MIQTSREDVMRDLGLVIQALGEYRKVAVMTGGFVPLMYRHVSGFGQPVTPSLNTFDFDWTLPRHAVILGTMSISRLLCEAGFVMIPSRGTEPPIQRFQHERYGCDVLAPVHVEFLVPLIGSANDRDGTDRGVMNLQSGVTAQALRYLELLLDSPIEFDASRVPELVLREPIMVNLPDPASYVLQKMLAWSERAVDKREKDLAYLFEVAMLTKGRRAEVAGTVRRLETTYPQEWFARVRRLVKWQFITEPAEGAIAVVRQYADLQKGVPTEASVKRIMTEFFDDIGLG